MPFKSKAQQRYMFASKPEVAKEMADKTTAASYKKLPDKVKNKKKGSLRTMLAALSEMSK